MIEVFKSNIKLKQQAELLAGEIRTRYPDYRVTFDLADCDKIIRVATEEQEIDVAYIVQATNSLQLNASVLPD